MNSTKARAASLAVPVVEKCPTGIAGLDEITLGRFAERAAHLAMRLRRLRQNPLRNDFSLQWRSRVR